MRSAPDGPVQIHRMRPRWNVRGLSVFAQGQDRDRMSGNFEAIAPPGDSVGRDNRRAGLLAQLAFKPMAQRDCPEALCTGYKRLHVPLHLSKCGGLHDREVSTHATWYVPFKELAGSSP